MNQELINQEIKKNLDEMYHLNAMIYDYWLSRLYEDDGVPIIENWTEENLNELFEDVKCQLIIDPIHDN